MPDRTVVYTLQAHATGVEELRAVRREIESIAAVRFNFESQVASIRQVAQAAAQSSVDQQAAERARQASLEASTKSMNTLGMAVTDLTARLASMGSKGGAAVGGTKAVDAAVRIAAEGMNILTNAYVRGGITQAEFTQKGAPLKAYLSGVTDQFGRFSKEASLAERALRAAAATPVTAAFRQQQAAARELNQTVSQLRVAWQTEQKTETEAASQMAVHQRSIVGTIDALEAEKTALRGKGVLDLAETRRVQELTQLQNTYSQALRTTVSVQETISGNILKGSLAAGVRAGVGPIPPGTISSVNNYAQSLRASTTEVDRLRSAETAGLSTKKVLAEALMVEVTAQKAALTAIQAEIVGLRDLGVLDVQQTERLDQLVIAQNGYTAALARSVVAQREAAASSNVLRQGMMAAGGRGGLGQAGMALGFVSPELGMASMVASMGPQVAGVAVAGLAVKKVVDLTIEGQKEAKALQQAFLVMSANGIKDIGGINKALDNIVANGSNAEKMFSKSELATSLAALARGGVTGADALTILKTSAQLAAAEHINLDDATKRLYGNLQHFGLSANEAAGFGDKLARSSHMSMATMDDLSKGLTVVGQTMKESGFSTSETLGMLVDLAKKGMDPATVGANGLRNAVMAVQHPSKQAAADFAALGVSVRDTNGHARSGRDIMMDLQGILSSSGPVWSKLTGHIITHNDAVKMIFDMFRARGATAFMSVLGNVKDLTAEVQNSQGFLQNYSETVVGGLSGAQARLDAATKNLSLTFAQLFTPALTSVVKMLQSGVTDLNSFVTSLAHLSDGVDKFAHMDLNAKDSPLLVFLKSVHAGFEDVAGSLDRVTKFMKNLGATTGLNKVGDWIAKVTGSVTVGTPFQDLLSDKAQRNRLAQADDKGKIGQLQDQINLTIETRKGALASGDTATVALLDKHLAELNTTMTGLKGDLSKLQSASGVGGGFEAGKGILPLHTGNKFADNFVDYCSKWVRLSLEKAHPQLTGALNKLFQSNPFPGKDPSADSAKKNFDRANLLHPFTGIGDLKPGDTVFYDNNHVGVYIGNGMVRGNNRVSFKESGGKDPVGDNYIHALGPIAGFARLSEIAEKMGVDKTPAGKPVLASSKTPPEMEPGFKMQSWDGLVAYARHLQRAIEKTTEGTEAWHNAKLAIDAFRASSSDAADAMGVAQTKTADSGKGFQQLKLDLAAAKLAYHQHKTTLSEYRVALQIVEDGLNSLAATQTNVRQKTATVNLAAQVAQLIDPISKKKEKEALTVVTPAELQRAGQLVATLEKAQKALEGSRTVINEQAVSRAEIALKNWEGTSASRQRAVSFAEDKPAKGSGSYVATLADLNKYGREALLLVKSQEAADKSGSDSARQAASARMAAFVENNRAAKAVVEIEAASYKTRLERAQQHGQAMKAQDQALGEEGVRAAQRAVEGVRLRQEKALLVAGTGAAQVLAVAVKYAPLLEAAENHAAEATRNRAVSVAQDNKDSVVGTAQAASAQSDYLAAVAQHELTRLQTLQAARKAYHTQVGTEDKAAAALTQQLDRQVAASQLARDKAALAALVARREELVAGTTDPLLKQHYVTQAEGTKAVPGIYAAQQRITSQELQAALQGARDEMVKQVAEARKTLSGKALTDAIGSIGKDGKPRLGSIGLAEKNLEREIQNRFQSQQQTDQAQHFRRLEDAQHAVDVARNKNAQEQTAFELRQQQLRGQLTVAQLQASLTEQERLRDAHLQAVKGKGVEAALAEQAIQKESGAAILGLQVQLAQAAQEQSIKDAQARQAQELASEVALHGKVSPARVTEIAGTEALAEETANSVYRSAFLKAHDVFAAEQSRADRVVLDAQETRDREVLALQTEAQKQLLEGNIKGARARLAALEASRETELKGAKGNVTQELAIETKRKDGILALRLSILAAQYDIDVAAVHARAARDRLNLKTANGGVLRPEDDATIHAGAQAELSALARDNQTTGQRETDQAGDRVIVAADKQGSAISGLRDKYHHLAEELRVSVKEGSLDVEARQKQMVAFNLLSKEGEQLGLTEEAMTKGARQATYALFAEGDAAHAVAIELAASKGAYDSFTDGGRDAVQHLQDIKISLSDLEAIFPTSGSEADGFGRALDDLAAKGSITGDVLKTLKLRLLDLKENGFNNGLIQAQAAQGAFADIADGARNLTPANNTLEPSEVNKPTIDVESFRQYTDVLSEADFDTFIKGSNLADEYVVKLTESWKTFRDTINKTLDDVNAHPEANADGARGLLPRPTDPLGTLADIQREQAITDHLFTLGNERARALLEEDHRKRLISEADYLGQRETLDKAAAQQQYEINSRGGMSQQEALAILQKDLLDITLRGVQEREKAQASLDAIAGIRGQSDLATLEFQHGRHLISESKYIDQREKLERTAAYQRWEDTIHSHGDQVLAEKQLQADLTAAQRKGILDRAKLDSGQVLFDKQKLALEDLANSYKTGGIGAVEMRAQAIVLAQELDKEAQAATRAGRPELAASFRDQARAARELAGPLGLAAEKLNQFSSFMDSAVQITGAFSKLTGAMGEAEQEYDSSGKKMATPWKDLTANLNGAQKAMELVKSVSLDVGKLFASGGTDIGSWVHLAITAITSVADAIGGYKKAQAEVIKQQADFNAGFKLIDGNDYAKTFTRSRGFFADVFGGGPQVVQEVDKIGLMYAKTLEGSILSGVTSGMKDALAKNDFSLFKKTLQSNVYDGIVAGLIDGFETDVIKGIMAPAMKEMTDAMKTPGKEDDARAVDDLNRAVDAANAAGKEFYDQVAPIVGRIKPADDVSGTGTSSPATTFGSVATAQEVAVGTQFYDAGTLIDAAFRRADAMYLRIEPKLDNFAASLDRATREGFQIGVEVNTSGGQTASKNTQLTPANMR